MSGKDGEIRAFIREMKPVEAFGKYSDDEELFFIVYYIDQSEPITNIREMCEDYAYQGYLTEDGNLTNAEIKHIIKLFQEHLV